MVTQDTIKSLLQTVERVSDEQLRHEICRMVTVVQDGYSNKHRELNAVQAENHSLKSQLTRNGIQPTRVIIYDPPV
ncbi:MAG: hypothetical protein JSU63_04500 [Phycisphaerales bacterium]|nr:MAG: hypothetical protein JSU63_04500 [Phycisphaerales bacterium]